MAARSLVWALVGRHVAEGNGARTAIREPKRAWSYTELAEEARRSAEALAALDVVAGDRVALLMHDSAEFAAVFLGALRVGAWPVPISTLWRGQDVIALLNNAEPRLVVCHPDLIPVVDEVLPELKARPVVVPLTQLYDRARAVAEAPNDDTVMLLYGGHPSGVARGVVHRAAALEASHASWARGVIGLTPEDRVFSTARLTSAYGLGAGLLFPLLTGAAACLLPDRTRPRAVFEAMVQLRPSVFCAVPSLYRQMIADFNEVTSPRPGYFDSVRIAVSGAEPLSATLAKRIDDTFGVTLVHGMGATEALSFFISGRPGDIRPGAAGRLLDGYNARIVDENGVEVGAQEIGVLEIRGPSVARGYWRHDVESARVFKEGGWYHTGDRFFLDADGWYYHCGRTDDYFKVSGKWVSPAEVEQTLIGHPAVWECAVAGEEDTDGLMNPVAYVVCNVGHTASQELGRELMEFVKTEISPYKYPRRIRFVDELPRDAAGKVQRWRLRRPAAQ